VEEPPRSRGARNRCGASAARRRKAPLELVVADLRADLHGAEVLEVVLRNVAGDGGVNVIVEAVSPRQLHADRLMYGPQ
jgi:hypothetical protein